MKRSKIIIKESFLVTKEMMKNGKHGWTIFKGIIRYILSKPTYYVIHVTVIGLALFVCVSGVMAKERVSRGNVDNNNLVALDFASGLGGIVEEVEDAYVIPEAEEVNPKVVAEIASVAQVPEHIDGQIIEDKVTEEKKTMAITSEDVLDKPQIAVTSIPGKAEGEVTNYIVEDGDTLWSIAQKFSVSTNSIKWSNGIENEDFIKPGVELKIPPVNGVVYVAKEGDNLPGIASYFSSNVQMMMDYNNLENEVVTAGQILVVPDGKRPEAPKPTPKPEPQTKVASNSKTKTASSGKRVGYGGGGNKFPYGYCTYYVASRRSVTWRGNAGAWLGNARAAGYATGYSPQAGAIVVTNESSVGHVAIVESVNGGSITLSEMNYAGFGVVSRRTISSGSGVIRGYIY